MHVIHLIDEHGMVGEGVLRFPHQVQVGQSRLDHQHVGTLRRVERRRANRLSTASAVTARWNPADAAIAHLHAEITKRE